MGVDDNESAKNYRAARMDTDRESWQVERPLKRPTLLLASDRSRIIERKT